MGRYYTGDIEGKFWFGVQSSLDAEYFGVTASEPSHANFYFDKTDLENIQEGINNCLEELGDYKQQLDGFFKAVNGYNDQIIAEHGFDVSEFKAKLEWYARLGLGQKILACVKEHGECNFEAEY